MEQFKWQTVGITLMETKFLYTCLIRCLWIKGFWCPVITDTSGHNLYLKHFYADYQIMVFDQCKFSIFTTNQKWNWIICGEQSSWNPVLKLAGWTFISKLLWFSLRWKQIIWKLCCGNARSAGSETVFSMQLLHASLHKGYTDFLKTSSVTWCQLSISPSYTECENIKQSWNSHLHNSLFLGNLCILDML